MSDERFDQDLRSVLVEDAPRDVPDELRRRVAAIPATHEVERRRPVWRLPIPLRVGALGALVVVLAIGWWRLGAASSDVGSQPSPSPSNGVIASPSPAPASGVVTACRAADLAARITGWQGAAGSRIAGVEIDNVTSGPCLIAGTPGLQLVDATGRVLIDSTTARSSGQPAATSPEPAFELAPGARLQTEVLVSNYCGPTPVPPIDVAFILPSGGGRLVAKPGPGVSSADAVPPCLGSTGAQIAMNGWRR